MEVRCDVSMRRSKEEASRWSWKTYGIPKWKCTGNCESCICGLVKTWKGTWEHNGGQYE